MKGERITLNEAMAKEGKRKKQFTVYDMYGSPVRAGHFRPSDISNKSGDSEWNHKRYRMDILFRILAGYEEDGEKFIFHYWINDLPITYNHYSRERALTLSYALYLFNIDYPYMKVFSIREERMIISNNMYLVPIRKQVRRDLQRESASESLRELEDIS